MNLSKSDIIKYVNFLDRYKRYVGLGDYKILLANTYLDNGDIYAEVSANIYEKTLKIALSTRIIDVDDKRKINILFHELVHARICVHNKRLEEINELEEEDLANDLTRGFDELGDLKFDKIRKKSKKPKNRNSITKQTRGTRSVERLLKDIPAGPKHTS